MKSLGLIVFFFISLNISAQTTWNGTSWSNGNPNNSTDAIINGNYSTFTNGEFTALNLNITASGILSIDENNTVTVVNNLDNLGSFTIQNSGSLVMVNDTGTVTGNYTMYRHTPDYPVSDINSFYSSPVLESDSMFSDIFNDDDVFYYWDTSASPTYWVQLSDFHFMGTGKGYAIRPDFTSGVIIRTYNGQFNTGDISVPVYFSDSSTSPGQFGYNIIGNPYPSAIDWFAFKADNASILSGTMYYWRQLEGGATNYASDYVAFNSLGVVPFDAATQYIAAGQGFVAKTNTTSSVTFKNSHRVANNNGQFFRPGNQSNSNTNGNIWLDITGGGNSSVTLVGFNANATTAFDSDYDGIFIGGTDPLQLYSMLATEKLLINGNPELVSPNNTAIPIGFKVTAAGDYTISIDNEFINSNYLILLEDTQLNSMTDLRLGDYTFNMTTTTEDNSRFILHFNYDASLSDIEVDTPSNSIYTYFDNENLVIRNNTNYPISLLQLHSIKGDMILSKTDNINQIEMSELTSGIYLLRVSYNNKSKIIRILKK